MRERVMAFIDGSNLYHSAKDEGIRLDFTTFLGLLKSPSLYSGEVRFIRPYFYGSTLGHQPQDSFHQKLMETGYDVRILPLRRKGGIRVEKGVDVWLAVDMVNFAARAMYDIAVLVSGDSDLLPACRVVKDWGKTLVLVTFASSCSQELRLVADMFVDLAPMRSELELK